MLIVSVSEFNEFEPRLKSAKNRFQLSAGLNLEKLNTKWNQPYLSRGLNLSSGSNSLNSASGFRENRIYDNSTLSLVMQCIIKSGLDTECPNKHGN